MKIGNMKPKKVSYSPLTRQDISNPRNGVKHDVNLEAAGVQNISNNLQIINLPNGRIIVRPDKK